MAIALYLVSHFLLYAIFLRRLPFFRREDVIFFYHIFSLPAALVIFGAFHFYGPAQRAAALVLVGSVHAIYSLSFLSFWSSSDAGYSLRILSYLETLGRADRKVDLADLEKLGGYKKMDRLESLVNLKLIEKRGEKFVETKKGRLIASGIILLYKICNIKMNKQDVAF